MIQSPCIIYLFYYSQISFIMLFECEQDIPYIYHTLSHINNHSLHYLVGQHTDDQPMTEINHNYMPYKLTLLLILHHASMVFLST